MCLDISANKLFKLEMLKELATKTPDLTMLNLSNNKVRSAGGYFDDIVIEQNHKKTCLLGFRPILTQTRLYSQEDG